jgi:aryl-alcohol dehydrogenase-like predicted oxidoreductase
MTAMKDKRRRLVLAGAGMVPSALASGLLPARAFAQSAALLRKKIPSSGEEIPIIGLGTARRYESARTEEERATLRETLQRFAAFGASVIDTAPVYGDAENVVGTLVEALALRPKLFLATKVSTGGAREEGREQIEGSFKRLRTSKIDLIAVHNLRGTETHLPALRELKQAGRIRYVGITTSFDGQYAEFERTMRRERLDFVQVDYALDNRNAGERILPLAAERGMAVMINLPFGRGRLFAAVRGKGLPPWSAEIDCRTWAQFFLKYVVSHPAVTCAVPGMARPEYVEDNLGAARGRLPDTALRRRMESFIDSL